MLTSAKLACFIQTFVVLLSTGLCVSRDATLSSSQNVSVFNGCKKVILDENICNSFHYCEDFVSVCKIFDTKTLVKPLGLLSLDNVKVTFNPLTKKYYLTFSVQLTSSEILEKISEKPEYTNTKVSYLKVTHVKFSPIASKHFELAEDVKLNEDWMEVDADEVGENKFVKLQFIATNKDTLDRIVQLARETKDGGLPGRIINEVVQMELKAADESYEGSLTSSLMTPLVEDKLRIIDEDYFNKLHTVQQIPHSLSDYDKWPLVPYLPDKQWILMQRRDTPGVDFNRNWKDYKTGFGSWENDFWLGLEKIHQITKDGGYGLRMEFESHKGLQRSAQWENFRVGSEEEKYKLYSSGFDTKSSAGRDSLAPSNGGGFATVDKDNRLSCAKSYGGGWWYIGAQYCHFNSQLRSSYGSSDTCVIYWNFNGHTDRWECLKRVRMFIIRH